MKEVKEYHDNGQIKCHYWKNEKGNIEGEYKHWYENGQINYHYWVNEKDAFEGEYKRWDENGQLVLHCFYKNGLLKGEYKSCWYDGQLAEQCFFRNNKRTDIAEYVEDVNNITECEYFHLQLTFGYFPIFKFDGKL